MMSAPASEPAPAVGAWPRLQVALAWLGLAGLAIITLTSPGATRVYASPWSTLYAATLAIPVLMLLLRAFDARQPLVLPDRSWLILILAVAAIVLLSAGTSPYAGSSLLWSAPLLAPLAAFLVIFDWLQAGPPEKAGERRVRLLTVAGVFFALVAFVSLALWLLNLPSSVSAGGSVLDARNPFPLGHSNYTAGISLLMLPCFAARARRTRGVPQVCWVLAALLALALLFTSGSRGGWIGLVVLVLAFVPSLARALRLKPWLVLLAGALLLAVLLGFNPRLRAMIGRTPPDAEPNVSNVQRAAMMKAGWLMGKDRPLLGWGPGTTPLAYPRYRAQLDGGAENVLQLHSLPIQLWGELGLAGIAAALALLALAARTGWSTPSVRPLLLAASGYAVFSLTDWQFDVPVFSVALAAACAWIAPVGQTSFRWRLGLGGAAVAGMAVIFFAGRRDPTPELDVRALEMAQNVGEVHRAITFLDRSLEQNPDQEIAHFNLGWLLVVQDPAKAEQHFLAAAHLVPDKGGVYFGLGLARLNQGRQNEAARAFALETLNDPIFLTSPWWRQPAIAALHPATRAATLQLLDQLEPRLPAGSFATREAAWLRALIPWLADESTVESIRAHADTAERRSYLATQTLPPSFATASVTAYRRERTGYPVLMRNLDLPPPTDLFDVQENTLAAGELRFLFPRKGWLPGPLAVLLLDQRN
jgi:O-antigen ligase